MISIKDIAVTWERHFKRLAILFACLFVLQNNVYWKRIDFLAENLEVGDNDKNGKNDDNFSFNYVSTYVILKHLTGTGW